MLYDLKTFNKDKASYDELVELSAFGRAIRQEFETLGGEVPDWVDRQIKALRREIHSRQADAADAKLAKAKARYAGLLKETLTPAEKLAAAKAEIEELEVRTKAGGA